ncbi:MAG TPA: hypothetical protein VM489_10615 [Burkholderiales bacterium]|nr:hypothetical protein [Burkholderiales bacterium]
MDQAAEQVPAKAEEKPRKKWPEMTRPEKTAHVLKVLVCIASFGFIFPTVGSD